MKKRNRIRPAGTLEERLRKFASDARAAAINAQEGEERKRLLKKARKAETIAGDLEKS